jgi:anti-anti-sigma factor
MEIGLSRKGELQVLSVKGNIRLQNWKVVDRHLDSLLEKGCRQVVLDLDGVTLICSTGVGALFHNVKRFRDRKVRLLLLAATPYMHGLLETFGGGPFMAENVVRDWASVAGRLGRE